MNFRDFEALAFDYWAEIPDDFKEGVDGVRVLRGARAHEELADVWTLGECVTESYPSDFGGPETTRSAVVLYHGSFAELARQDDAFDWEDELWETLTHELRHHLESLAAEDALEDVDYAADENFKRHDGERFDPFFHRSAEPVAGAERPTLTVDGGAVELSGAWHVEGDWFFEVTHAAERPLAGAAVLDWAGARHAFALPETAADVAFVALADGFEPRPIERRRIEDVCVVLVRGRSWWRGALDALRGRAPTVDGVEVRVRTTTAAA